MGTLGMTAMAIASRGLKTRHRDPVDPRTTMLALGCVLHGTVVLGSHLRPASVMEIAKQAVELFFRGLRSESTCLSGSLSP